MNLYRLLNQLKTDEDYKVRQRLLIKLKDKPYFSEDEINELLAYKRMGYHSNLDARRITLKTFTTPDLSEKFRLLKRLNGVGVIMASTILMFQNPHRYAEINHACWNNLMRNWGFKGSDKDNRSDFGIPEYINYLETLRSIADEYGMNVGDVEYVLGHTN